MERMFYTNKGNKYYAFIDEKYFENFNKYFFKLAEIEKEKFRAHILHQTVKLYFESAKEKLLSKFVKINCLDKINDDYEGEVSAAIYFPIKIG